ncbi:MAG: response regulator, partial [Xanthobacteraceae bacterium]
MNLASGQPRDIVLVVDDSPDTLKMVTDAFEDAGMTVLVALEGEQALTMLEKVTPDVILMDAVMPGIDGFETCRRLKGNNRLTHVPVIFMTGLSDTEDIVKGLEAGGVDYVTKPIVPDELLARIRVHLGNARRAQGAHAALDTLGRYLLAANRAGEILWCTPQAARLLGAAFANFDGAGFALPPEVKAWLGRGGRPAGEDAEGINLVSETSDKKLRLSYVGQIGPDEILLRLIEGDVRDDKTLLKVKLSLTVREAEV